MIARKHWHDHRNPAEAFKLFPSKFSAERGILGFFKDHGKDTKNLLGAIGNVSLSIRTQFHSLHHIDSIQNLNTVGRLIPCFWGCLSRSLEVSDSCLHMLTSLLYGIQSLRNVY